MLKNVLLRQLTFDVHRNGRSPFSKPGEECFIFSDKVTLKWNEEFSEELPTCQASPVSKV